MKIDREGAYELDRIPSTIRAGSELLPVSLPREGCTSTLPLSEVSATLRPRAAGITSPKLWLAGGAA